MYNAPSMATCNQDTDQKLAKRLIILCTAYAVKCPIVLLHAVKLASYK